MCSVCGMQTAQDEGKYYSLPSCPLLLPLLSYNIVGCVEPVGSNEYFNCITTAYFWYIK